MGRWECRGHQWAVAVVRQVCASVQRTRWPPVGPAHLPVHTLHCGERHPSALSDTKGCTWACRLGSRRSKHPIWAVLVCMMPAPTKFAGLGSTSSRSAEPKPIIWGERGETGARGTGAGRGESPPRGEPSEGRALRSPQRARPRPAPGRAHRRAGTLALVTSASIGCLALKMLCTSC